MEEKSKIITEIDGDNLVGNTFNVSSDELKRFKEFSRKTAITWRRPTATEIRMLLNK